MAQMQGKNMVAHQNRGPSAPLLSTEDITRISSLIKTLAHAHRLAILEALRGEECSVTELCHRTGLAQAQLSQQLATLRRSGLVSTERDGRFVYYRLNNPAFGQFFDTLAELEVVTELN
ncbi:helix-turn-helix transcriptional regulator [Martelella alba]|uniref:Helix-turn-helix transcriptional regulator n=1 Tax=Martelella alba TaxID=2590451 RepID=A0A506UD40_9HYPH|nr:metalloregulator ArsR/SmtB family transcription factor [Martelella alba]TPW32363.1 helix-turn-helix transcriptional regulator [Martelella alba]